MKNITKNCLCFLISLSCLLCGCQKEKQTFTPSVTGAFDFTILKAGQADAIIMQTKNHSIVLDMGEKDDSKKILQTLSEKNISNIDYVFITHFDKDHIGAFPKVMEQVSASNIFVPNYEGNNDEYTEYIKTISTKNLNVTPLTEDTTFEIDDVLFEVSVPKKKVYANGDNDYSLVISVTHGENTFLFTGDAQNGRLPEVLSEFGRQYDFLKVPHHGKHNKYTKQFINTIKPTYAVVTDSEKNPANDKVISLFNSLKTELYSTKNGDVYVVSDGKKITISQ